MISKKKKSGEWIIEQLWFGRRKYFKTDFHGGKKERGTVKLEISGLEYPRGHAGQCCPWHLGVQLPGQAWISLGCCTIAHEATLRLFFSPMYLAFLPCNRGLPIPQEEIGRQRGIYVYIKWEQEMDMSWPSVKQNRWEIFIKQWYYRIDRLRKKVISENVLLHLALTHGNESQRSRQWQGPLWAWLSLLHLELVPWLFSGSCKLLFPVCLDIQCLPTLPVPLASPVLCGPKTVCAKAWSLRWRLEESNKSKKWGLKIPQKAGKKQKRSRTVLRLVMLYPTQGKPFLACPSWQWELLPAGGSGVLQGSPLTAPVVC